MKISIVTVTKNSARTLERTMRSVLGQRHPDVEHLIKDAGSTDNTRELAQSVSASAIVINQADRGIYDAMNQGFAACTGEVVAFLNSDDHYADDQVLAEVAAAFERSGADYVYGDVEMTDAQGQVVRRWVTTDACLRRLRAAQIPHPALFVRRSVLAQLSGPFDPSYRISADLKQQLLLINRMQVKGHYLPRTLAVMEIGGASTSGVRAYWRGWQESRRAYNEVEGRGGSLYVARKVLSKLPGFRIAALRT
ncbi:glycosyltransferase [Ideonella sp. 4Y11]|uniref:Glycosyltransferase n=1 Tax=Ideonella aquatica TaxID=2824119 RepID=A0A941BI93_9BURK|nr:glycosyltransferase family 2 protein [Ideonella aquatica]MBQ0958347.1 glycosyltransferase [Ideonella aquatica]